MKRKNGHRNGYFHRLQKTPVLSCPDLAQERRHLALKIGCRSVERLRGLSKLDRSGFRFIGRLRNAPYIVWDLDRAACFLTQISKALASKIEIAMISDRIRSRRWLHESKGSRQQHRPQPLNGLR